MNRMKPRKRYVRRFCENCSKTQIAIPRATERWPDCNIRHATCLGCGSDIAPKRAISKSAGLQQTRLDGRVKMVRL